MSFLKTPIAALMSAALTGAVFGAPFFAALVTKTSSPIVEVTHQAPLQASLLAPELNLQAAFPTTEAPIVGDGEQRASAEEPEVLDEGLVASATALKAQSKVKSKSESKRIAVSRGEIASSKKQQKARRCQEQPISQISKNRPFDFTIDRELVSSYTRNFSRLNSLGWSRGHKDDQGKKDGMLIGGIKCGSDLHLAGIRSGDVVHSVNGHSVKSITGALLTYSRVRKDPVLKVQITRRGQAKTLVYRLRG